MHFESLFNDILLDLFEYFDTIHLLRAFFGLNSRFDTLLYKHFRGFHLDLRRVSKQDFDNLCQQHLRSIVDRIVSLRMGENDETPGLPELFLSRGFTLDQFIHLRSLLLYCISGIDIIRILGELDRLVHLIHLNISRWHHTAIEQRDTCCLLNRIWNLPKLTHVTLEYGYGSVLDFTELTMISSTLDHLSISTRNPHPLSDMTHIFRYTPRLRVLSVYADTESEDAKFPTLFPSIITLDILFIGQSCILNNLFQKMPNLSNLRIEMPYSYLNGYEWKHIIVDYLPNLKILRFKMSLEPFREPTNEQQVDELLDTFRTPFWLDEHEWYVRCDWGPPQRACAACLYTLPYGFGTFIDIAHKGSKWTCPDDKQDWSFDRVYKFDCRCSTNNCLYLHPACFPNVYDLETPLPLPDKFWSIISTLDHFNTLCVSICMKDFESNFQTLLDRAPRLYTLVIDMFIPKEMLILSRFRSASIRQLRLFPNTKHRWLGFNDVECTAFARSLLGLQCEVLEIQVKSQESIVNLVNAMVNLRAMSIHCTCDNNEQPCRTEAELIEWAQNHLPTRCWISNYSNSETSAFLHLWIG